MKMKKLKELFENQPVKVREIVTDKGVEEFKTGKVRYMLRLTAEEMESRFPAYANRKPDANGCYSVVTWIDYFHLKLLKSTTFEGMSKAGFPILQTKDYAKRVAA